MAGELPDDCNSDCEFWRDESRSEGVESRDSVCAFSEVLWLPNAVEGSCCTTTSRAANCTAVMRHAVSRVQGIAYEILHS